MRQKRVERRNRRYALLRLVLLAVGALLVAGILYEMSLGMKQSITRWNRDIEVAQVGTLEDKAVGIAVIVNREVLISTGDEGRFENMVRDREKIGRGALLGYFYTSQSKTPLRAEISGIFLRQTDGLEDYFRELKMPDVNDDTFNQKPYSGSADPEQLIPAGMTVGKIVDSLQPTRIIFKMPAPEFPAPPKPHQSVKLVQDNSLLSKAYLLEWRQEADNMYVLLECDGFCESLLGQRYVNLEVVFNTYEGYVVPEKALVEKAGKKGIYCASGEDIYFKPVEILKIKAGTAVVEGLSVNDMIVHNPPPTDD